jgi:hypothetical protein
MRSSMPTETRLPVSSHRHRSRTPPVPVCRRRPLTLCRERARKVYRIFDYSTKLTNIFALAGVTSPVVPVHP